MLRSLGLIALDRVPALQAEFVRRGMGFRGHVPQLALRDANQMAPGLAAGTRR
jgi:hypothetical protein